MTEALIGIGSNLGDREALILSAIGALCTHPSIRLIRTAPLIQTKAIARYPQPDFLNTAVRIATSLGPMTLLQVTQDIEYQLGRTTKSDYAPRSIDLDILLFGQHIVSDTTLTIPHPRFSDRFFALRPAVDIAPDWIHPSLGESLQTLLDKLL